VSVAALFVDPNGPYPKLLGDELCWDEARDARTYLGPHPVVAHPPCHLWVNMAAVNWKRYGRQKPAWYPGGTDGGCFNSALVNLLLCGGALEHPASSHAFAKHGLVAPVGIGWNPPAYEVCRDANGFRNYWTCEVWQSAYGHKARKRTWLLYCGNQPPFELRWDRNPGTHQVGWFDRNKPTLSKAEASRTPVAFAEELIRLAKHARGGSL
jgi:hypothetical protein